MEDKPEYEFRGQVVDLNTGEIVATESCFIPYEKRTNVPVAGMEDLNEEAAETAFWDLMRHFRNGGQQAHEKLAYSEEEETI